MLAAFATGGGFAVVGVVIHVGTIPDSSNLVKRFRKILV